MSKELIESALVPIRAQQAKQQGEMEQLKLSERIVTLQVEIQELQVKHPLPWDAFIAKMDELALVERRQKQFTEYIAMLFPKGGEEEEEEEEEEVEE